MADHQWRKLTFEEIIEDAHLMLDEESKAYQSGATFVLGIDNTPLGYCIRINYSPVGIYLYQDEIEFWQRSFSDHVALITPHLTLNGEIQAKALDMINDKGDVVGKSWRDITIYVHPNAFEKFIEEARVIYSQYSRSDLCFRGIPDIWFEEMDLIKFMRERLMESPYLEFWFSHSHSGTPYWLTPPQKW